MNSTKVRGQEAEGIHPSIFEPPHLELAPDHLSHSSLAEDLPVKDLDVLKPYGELLNP